MKIIDIFSHRNGRDILESPNFRPAFTEFLNVILALPPFLTAKPKKTATHVVSPKAMNRWLDYELCVKKDWDWRPLIIDPDPSNTSPQSKLRSDYRKARVEVEVQFGNVARYAYDVYKMAIAMALGLSDVGIQVVCTKKFANITGGNIAYFERAARELEHSRLTLIVPLVVVGIEPDEWNTNVYAPESQSPVTTAAVINEALRKRGRPPVPEEVEEDEQD